MKKILTVLLAIMALCACDKNTRETDVPVSSISLNLSTAEMIIGENTQLQVSISPSNATDKTVIWGSSKQSVATVSNSGLVTAVAEGNTTITATAGGKSATCSVTVSKGIIAVTSVELNKTSLELVEGESETLTATVKPDDAMDKTVTWTTSDASIATVENGKVTAVKEGETTITASVGSKSMTCKVVVVKKVIAVESIALNKTEIILSTWEAETLIATVSPSDATDKTITWSSSNTSIATVDGNGKVETNYKEGFATISAKVGKKTATCSVTVKKGVIPVSSITLDKSELSLHKGQSRTLTASISPMNATDRTVIWSSSNTSIATVDNGTVKAINEGNIVITAYAGEKNATCSVIVKQALPSNAVDLGLSVSWAQCNLGATESTDPGDYYAWGETEPKYKPGHSQDDPMDPTGWKTGVDGGYDWRSYKYGEKPNKYNGVDLKRVLESDDDAAHVNLGGAWRTPTYQDWAELNRECTWVWDNEKVAYVVTGPNNNSIFLPVACYRIGIYLRDPETGRYWSSNLYEYEPYQEAYCVSLAPSSWGFRLSHDYRPRGLFIRPVID